MRYPFHFVICISVLGSLSCEPRREGGQDAPRNSPSSTVDLGQKSANTGDRVLARLGSVEMDLPEYRRAIGQTRILRKWRSNADSPLEALQQTALKRKIMLRALETRVVRAEVTRLNIAIDAPQLQRLMVNAARGNPPDYPISADRVQSALADMDELEARIVARFGTSLAQVKRVAQDLLEHQALAKHLLDHSQPELIKHAWTDELRCVDAELFLIPRVPTSREIDQAVSNAQAGIKAFYKGNPRLFNTPARTFARRLLLPNRDAKKDRAAKEILEALRQRVIDGEDMEKLVNEHGFPRDRRTGGRKTISQKKSPELFDLPIGHVTPVKQHPEGWVFYKVEGKGEAIHRPLQDRRVQREAAAAVLRNRDLLPTAKRLAGLVAHDLRKKGGPDALDEEMLRRNRIRRSRTKRFCQKSRRHVPTIGLAKNLRDRIFGLKTGQRVTNPIAVRQDYVVAYLHTDDRPTDAQWSLESAAFTERWRKKNQPTVVRDWLRSISRTDKPWVDLKALKALSIETLREP